MLTTDDIKFLVTMLDKGTYQGLESAHKIVEVFLKLQQLAKVTQITEKKEDVPPQDEPKVSEDEEEAVV